MKAPSKVNILFREDAYFTKNRTSQRQNNSHQPAKQNIPSENENDDEENDNESESVHSNLKLNVRKKNFSEKLFERHYEIITYNKQDYLINANNNKYFQKLPKHLMASLMPNDNVKRIRLKENQSVFFYSEELKRKAWKMYRQRLFYKALLFLLDSYSLLKWAEFEDKTIETEFFNNLLKSDKSIQDSNLKVVITGLSVDYSSPDYDKYKGLLVSLLKSMSYCYLELWNYSEAEKCLKEALELSEDQDPDVYFRLGQVKLYNKSSKEEELADALSYFSKANRLLSKSKLSSNDCIKESRKRLSGLLEKENERLIGIVKANEDEVNKRKKGLIQQVVSSYNFYSNNECYLTTELCQRVNIIYEKVVFKKEILNRMRMKYELAIKYYSETDNSEQLKLTYDEIDSLSTIEDEFCFYISIDKLIKKDIPTSKDLNLDLYRKLIDLCKYRMALNVFDNASFNQELLKEVMSQLVEPEINSTNSYYCPKGLSNNIKFRNFSTGLVLIFMLIISFITISIQSYYYNVKINEERLNVYKSLYYNS